MSAAVSYVPEVDLPLVVAEVEVVGVEVLSPSFVRVTLGGEAIAEVGVDGQPLYDQRFKLVVPTAEGALYDVTKVDADWYGSWRRYAPEERGHMRTYTIRALEGSGDERRLVVDIVVHPDGGDTGPGAQWAERAEAGDRVVIVAPRMGYPFGGIEFSPSPGDDVLFVADETALPAVAAILETLPADATGNAYVEVPLDADVQKLEAPVGVNLHWLPRNGSVVGMKLHEAVADHLHREGCWRAAAADAVDPDLWETPIFSSSGDEVAADDPARDFGRYAWVAGEAGLVKSVRRLLSAEEWPRSHSAFMGYWREGVSMKS